MRLSEVRQGARKIVTGDMVIFKIQHMTLIERTCNIDIS